MSMSLQKSLFLFSSLFFAITFSSAQRRSESIPVAVPDTTINSNRTACNQISLCDSIVNYGKLFLNRPYHYGSPGSDTFDCSGFTSFVYRNFGYNLQRSSAEQAQQFDSVDRNQLKAGDLVFFSGRRRSKSVGHVGIVTTTNGNGQFEFIHAAVHSGVTISNSEEPYYTKRFIKANRVLSSDPLLAVLNRTPITMNSITSTTFTNVVTPFSNNVVQTRKVVPAVYHKVKSGETLSSIAHKFGISIPEIKRKNNLKGSHIQPRQLLKIKNEETVMIVEPVKVIAQNSSDKQSNSNKEIAITKNDSVTLVKSPGTHVVQKGETLFSISKQFNVSVEDLKIANKLQNGLIKPNQVLVLNKTAQLTENNTGNKPNKESSRSVTTKHKVKKGETLSGISKLNNISIEDLKRINNLKSNNLTPGQELQLGQIKDSTNINSGPKVESVIKSKTHKVKSGESLFSIAKKYNISIDELKNINHISGNNIHPDQKLIINKAEESATIDSQVKPEKKHEIAYHKVKSSETFISIAKDYDCTVRNLKDWNHKTGSKIKIGEKLIVHPK